MRNRLTVKHSEFLSFPQALKISTERAEELDLYLKKEFSKDQPITDVFEKVWNDKKLSDNEVILCIFGIGMQVKQAQINDEAKNLLGNLMGKIKDMKGSDL